MIMVANPRAYRGRAASGGGGGGGGELTLNAKMWRFDGSSGSVQPFGTVLLKPGQVTPATLRSLKMYVAGNEVALARQPMHGSFPDGSYRAVGIQPPMQNLSNTMTDVQIKVGGAASGLSDLTWVEPIYSSASASVPAMNHRAVVALWDQSHLCETMACLTPLLPESSRPANTMTTFFQPATGTTNTLGAFYDYAQTNDPDNGFGGSTYPHTHGAWAVYMSASNDATRKWYFELAYKQLVNSCGGGTYNRLGVNNPSYAKVYGWDASLPVALTPDDYALFPEQNCGIYFSWVTGYWATGWKQPWLWLAHKSSGEWKDATTYAAHAAQMISDTTRFNMWRRMLPGLCAYLVEATVQVPGGYGAGRNNDVCSFVDQIGWALDALDNNKFTTANYGAYINNVVGQSITFNEGNGAGVYPVFQSAAVTPEVLYLIYASIKNDSRIPGWIVALADFVNSQLYYDSGTDYWGSKYLHKAPPIVLGDIGDNDWFLVAMHGLVNAMAYAITGTASYKTKAEEALRAKQLSDPPGPNGNFTPNWKACGEYFDGFKQASLWWLYGPGGGLRPFANAHATTIVNPPTYAG